MKIKDLLADSFKKSGADRSKHKGKAKADVGVLTIISAAARKATEEVIKRRKASEKEMARWRKAVKKEAARIAAEEKAAQEEAVKTVSLEEAAAEESAGMTAVEEAAGTAAEAEANEEAARLAAEEKAARKAAKKQKAAGETALWAAEAIRALGDGAELYDGDAVAKVRNVCDSLEWKRLKNITGCQIEYSLHEDFSDSRKEKIKKSHDLDKLEKKLEAGKTYYVRVRVCSAVKDKKVCSDWSEVMTLQS